MRIYCTIMASGPVVDDILAREEYENICHEIDTKLFLRWTEEIRLSLNVLVTNYPKVTFDSPFKSSANINLFVRRLEEETRFSNLLPAAIGELKRKPR